MMWDNKKRESIINTVCILYIILFMYAAVIKLIDHDQFVIQIAKSPMLTSYKTIVSWMVPFAEIAIALLLVSEKTRRIGLFSSFTLMMMFTFYIIAILNFSEYIPCSCGGILEKMSWEQHLIFNVVFCLLAVTAIVLDTGLRNSVRTVIILPSFALGVVVILFNMTYEDKNKFRTFDRILADNRLMRLDSISLDYNSFYFAGSDNEYVYIANETAPSYLTTIRITDGKRDSRNLVLSSDLKYQKIKTSVLSQHIFLQDGSSSEIFRGCVNNLLVSRYPLPNGPFSESLPIGPSSFVMRISDKDNNYLLAKVSSSTTPVFNDALLKKQVDGHFSVDGMLLYNELLKKILYVYYYRNQYLVIDTLLNLSHLGKTLDTVSVAKIKVTNEIKGDRLVSSVVPLVTVNRLSCTYSKYLFINSKIPAKNEDEWEIDNHSRIDIFDIERGRYVKSFNLPYAREVRSIHIAENKLYSLVNKTMITYDLSKIMSECDEESYQRNFTGQ